MSKKEFKNIQEMSAFLTHGINTHLTYMKGNLEIMELDLSSMSDGKLKDDLLQAQEKLLDGIEKIEDIVDVLHSVTKNSQMNPR